VLTKCPRGVDTGVYLLGGLAAGECAQFARHLEDCPECRGEVDELAPVARLLALALRDPSP
jgi:anti-sigma factor RsiW